jgi:hypothetical protein
MSVRIHNGVEYHYAHSSVKCVADRDGCEVFEINLGAGKEKILALDARMAREEYFAQNACADCQCIHCQCDSNRDD